MGRLADVVLAVGFLIFLVVILVTLGITWNTIWSDIRQFFGGASVLGLAAVVRREGAPRGRPAPRFPRQGTGSQKRRAVPVLLAAVLLLALPGLGSATQSQTHVAGSPPPIRSISVYTTYPGQNQYLAIPPNTSGVLVYPTWVITLVTDENLSYTIYVNGLRVDEGVINGQSVVQLNVTGQTVSVNIGFGDTIYRYNNEFLSTVPLSAYYAPPPPPLVATEEQVLIQGVQVLGAFVMAVLGAMFVARRIVIERRKRQIQEL